MQGEVRHSQPTRKLWQLVQQLGAGTLLIGLALFYLGDFTDPWAVFVTVGSVLLLFGSVLTWRYRG